MEKSIERRAAEWALSDDTGISSTTIARHMLGVECAHSGHPHDNGDLGRCIRLLDIIPEWRERLQEMAAYSPAWAALVEHWAEIESMFRADHQGWRLYDRIKAILAGAESRSRSEGAP